jgi:hypothetical protein
MQRTAGNAAVARALCAARSLRRPPVRQVRRRILQRNVGFEFELEDPSVYVYEYSYWNRDYMPPAKRTRVLDGDGFYVETDYLSGGNASWEFVTEPFPETGPGLLELQQALMAIDGIVNVLRTSAQNTYLPVAGAFAAFGTPRANRYYTLATPVFRTKPQVSAGLDLTALNALFNAASSPAGPGVSNLVRNVGSMDDFGRVAAAQVDPQLGAMWAAADVAVGNAYGGLGAGVGTAGRAALQALTTQAMQMILGGQQNIGVTPKTVLRLALHRTDFKTMFAQLPVPLRTNIEAAPANFAAMVMAAVGAIAVVPGGNPVISANLFTDPSMQGDPHYNMPSPYTQVSCTQWLTEIARPGGSDLLSADHYPIRTRYLGAVKDSTDVKANELLGSVGALHNKLDPGNRPIFELRSSKRIHAGLIPAYALDFFKYIRYLHNPGALTETAFLTGMAQADVIDLVGFTPNRPAVTANLQGQAFAAHAH